MPVMKSVKSPMCWDTVTSCSGWKYDPSQAVPASMSISTTVSSRGIDVPRGYRFSVRAKRVSRSARYGEAGSFPMARSWKLARIARSKKARSSTPGMIANSYFARIRARGRPADGATSLVGRARERHSSLAGPVRAVWRLYSVKTSGRGPLGLREGPLQARGGAPDEDRAAGPALRAPRATDLGAHVRARHAHPAPRGAREAARRHARPAPLSATTPTLAVSETPAIMLWCRARKV